MTLHGVQQPAPKEAVYGVMCVPFPAIGTPCSSWVIHDWRQALQLADEVASAPVAAEAGQLTGRAPPAPIQARRGSRLPDPCT